MMECVKSRLFRRVPYGDYSVCVHRHLYFLSTWRCTNPPGPKPFAKAVFRASSIVTVFLDKATFLGILGYALAAVKVHVVPRRALNTLLYLANAAQILGAHARVGKQRCQRRHGDIACQTLSIYSLLHPPLLTQIFFSRAPASA